MRDSDACNSIVAFGLFLDDSAFLKPCCVRDSTADKIRSRKIGKLSHSVKISNHLVAEVSPQSLGFLRHKRFCAETFDPHKEVSTVILQPVDHVDGSIYVLKSRRQQLVLAITDHQCQSSRGKRSNIAERDTRSGVFQVLNGKHRGYSVP